MELNCGGSDESIWSANLLRRKRRIWKSCTGNALGQLNIRHSFVVGICLNKKKLSGSTLLNYKDLNVHPVKYL